MIRTYSLPDRRFSGATFASVLQRKCACGQHTGGGECEECKKKKGMLQRQSNGLGGPAVAPPIVHEVLRSPGQPLDAATRAFFEPRFDHDFSQVRVHSNEAAAASARSVNGLAYTVGSNIVFAGSRFAPYTTAGKRLLAHELTHTVQQQYTTPRLSRAGDDVSVDTQDELEAEAVDAEVLAEEEEEVPEETVSEQQRTAEADIEARSAPVRKRGKSKVRKRKRTKPKPKPNPCTRSILWEGTCEFLAKKAANRCCDPEKGVLVPDKDVDVEGKPCPSHKFTPGFACDTHCKDALERGCSDSDNWLALPHSQWTRKQCDDVWTICANGKRTTGYVRDRSDKERFEVGRKIAGDLGVPEDTFKGSVFKPGADPKKIDADPCCSGAGTKASAKVQA